ncbi:class I SAM-dependent methyltransferase [Nitriliruptoraceae bacterium ZYF776]|nr:class I SAM-dependent methyltransferase [Profundirhabdus halotolerans]
MEGPLDARARWDARYAGRDAPPGPASRYLTERAHLLPITGRALDVAGGIGRHALWLAQRGLAVTLVDVSGVALEQAARAAAAAARPLEVLRSDLSTDPLPEGPFDVVLVHHYLDLAVWRSLPARLAGGGVLLVCHPTVRNLDRHDRPSRRFLLPEHAAVEVAADLAAGDPHLEVLEATEGWTDEGRHEAHIVVRRRPVG